MLKCNIGKFLSKPTLGFRKGGELEEEDGKFSNYNKKEGHTHKILSRALLLLGPMCETPPTSFQKSLLY